GRRAPEGALRRRRRGGQGIHERQHLPLRGLSEHRRGHPAGPQERLTRNGTGDSMHTFEFVRPPDSAAAVAAAARAKTVQQGADVRFIAGGTTLVDLMKLNVETPGKLIDINRLPLGKIEPA